MTSNAEIGRVLQELVDLLVMAEGSKQAFRVRAYEKAVAAVQALPQDAAAMTAAELVKVPGIGKSTAGKIREYVDTGAVARITALRQRFPAEMMELRKDLKQSDELEQSLSRARAGRCGATRCASAPGCSVGGSGGSDVERVHPAS